MGAQKYETADAKKLLIFDYRILRDSGDFKPILQSFGQRETLSIRDELKCKDRHKLDDVIFDILGLTKSERDAVYEAVIDLVESRLRKASSLEV